MAFGAWKRIGNKTNTAASHFSQGVFADGKFTNLEDLIKTVSSIIFVSSVGHAAANFAQYDEYAFPPNYPAYIRGKPPTSKVV